MRNIRYQRYLSETKKASRKMVSYLREDFNEEQIKELKAKYGVPLDYDGREAKNPKVKAIHDKYGWIYKFPIKEWGDDLKQLSQQYQAELKPFQDEETRRTFNDPNQSTFGT